MGRQAPKAVSNRLLQNVFGCSAKLCEYSEMMPGKKKKLSELAMPPVRSSEYVRLLALA